MGERQIGHSGYRPAIRLAWAQLKRGEPADRLAGTGARPGDGGAVVLRCFGDDYAIDAAEESIRRENGEEPHIGLKILLLHYLNTASDLPAKNKEIGFAQIPGATGYLAPFNGRVVFPLVKMFDNFGEKTAAAFAKIGADAKDFATQCYVVQAFPRVPITVIFWSGDEEIASGGQIVFDEGITGYLCIEDVVITCEEMVRRLREILS